MRLTPEQVEQFESDGFLFLPEVFSNEEVDRFVENFEIVCHEDQPGRIFEKDGNVVRTVFGSHRTNPVYRELSEDPRIVGPAMDLLKDDVYIHQFKINAKMAFQGDVWQWHQDYIYWLREDGMMKPLALTASIWLDDVHEFNGPLMLVPGSHQVEIDTPARDTAPAWMATVIADLKYSLGVEELKDLIARKGIVAPKGPRGSVLLFHCNVVHGSVPNMSPFHRRIVFVSFNSMANPLMEMETPRPSFLANRQYETIRLASRAVMAG